MKVSQIMQLLADHKIYFSLATHRNETIMLIASVPGERWEIEVFEDNSVEVEVFASKGEIRGEAFLLQRVKEFSDRELR